MTRIVELADTKPLKVDPKEQEKPLWICRCGLSQDWPYCDGSHKATRDEEEGKRYAYHRDAAGRLQRKETDAIL